ncbi:MAG: hypothetical protein WCC00_03565 [Candidatus Aminicenantales bacterium]
MRCGHGSLGHLSDSHGEELQPGFPIPGLADFGEQVEIFVPVLFEIEAEIEKRLTKDPFVAEQEGDQESADPPVAVEKGVDCFELGVRQRGFDQGRRLLGNVMKELFPLSHRVCDSLGRSGHIKRVSRACSLDPVLGATKLTGVLVTAATFRKQDPMHFPDQPVRKREVFAEPLEAMIHRLDIAGDLDDVIEGHAWYLFQLEEKKV